MIAVFAYARPHARILQLTRNTNTVHVRKLIFIPCRHVVGKKVDFYISFCNISIVCSALLPEKRRERRQMIARPGTRDLETGERNVV